MDKHKYNGNYFQLHPHRHTGSCRTDETETSGDLNCLLHFEVGNAKLLFLILILNLTTWLVTPDFSPLPNAAPSHIRIAFFQLFWTCGTNYIMILGTCSHYLHSRLNLMKMLINLLASTLLVLAS
jgi:hypothetical protein